jgi:hypothetical protein
MTDLLDEARREIDDRLKELKPAVDEYSRLEAAASALAKVGGSAPAAATAPRRRGPGRPRSSVNRASKAAAPGAEAPAATPVKAARKKPGPQGSGKKVGRPPGRPEGRGGRRKGSGTRTAQTLSLVRAQPGITIPELAAKMGIKQNYLYRVLPGLERERRVRREGRGWTSLPGDSGPLTGDPGPLTGNPGRLTGDLGPLPGDP